MPRITPPAVLRALRVPAELDREIEVERAGTRETRTAAMVRRLERRNGGPPPVDWAEFDRQVQIAKRQTPSTARALKAARKAMGL